MAKLNGVKTLDMQNGEITRVEYNGVEYVKVPDGQARKGDIAEVTKPWGNQITGAFYNVIQDGHDYYSDDDDLVYIDGEVGHASHEADRVKLFRTVSAIKDDGYRKVTDRKPKTGDFVKFTDEDELPSYIKLGKYYEIIEIDDADDPQIIDEDGDEFDTASFEIEVYEKVSVSPAETGPADELTHNGATYTLVDRKAQPGDVVVFTESKRSYVQNGKPYGPINHKIEFADDDDDKIYVYNDDEEYNRTPANVKVYEPVAKVEPTVTRPTIGDHVKVTAKHSAHRADIGDIVKVITDVHDRQPYECEALDGRYVGWFRESEVEKVGAGEIASISEAAKWAKIGRKPNEFKKGDVIKITRYQHGAKEEALREVRSVGDTYVGYDGGYFGDFNTIELITPVEARFDK